MDNCYFMSYCRIQRIYLGMNAFKSVTGANSIILKADADFDSILRRTLLGYYAEEMHANC